MDNGKKIVLYDSDEAATYKTNIEGWVNREGRFWGKDEHMARYSGCTHMKCECGNLFERTGYSKCKSCRSVDYDAMYMKMPFKEWNGVTPVATWSDDKFFFSSEDIEEYCENEDVNAADLQLVICEPNTLREIPFDLWDDVLPEDTDLHEIDKQLVEKVDELNKYIATLKPASWTHGKYRTSY